MRAETYFTIWREPETAAEGWQIEIIELEPDLYFAARVRREKLVKIRVIRGKNQSG